MPLDYEEFSTKCDAMSIEELHKEWNNYTRQISGGATTTTLSVTFAPLTMGASLIGLGLSAPRIHNARKKRAIIEAHLQACGTTYHTRKRDVMGAMALSTTIGGITLGMAPAGAHEMGMMAAEHAIHAIAGNPHTVEAVAHVALDGVGSVMEEKHDKKTHEKSLQRLRAKAAMMEKKKGGLAPPAYDASGVSDDDDVDIMEIEKLLKELKKRKRPIVTVREL
ncbi:hypothetical protein MMC19_002628 [Ptychographa xylographoides]|nr:hypothetical protein [Ptychographa xylographoides]